MQDLWDWTEILRRRWGRLCDEAGFSIFLSAERYVAGGSEHFLRDENTRRAQTPRRFGFRE